MDKSDILLSRKKFLKQSTLSLLGLSSAAILGLDFRVDNSSRSITGASSVFRTIQYNIFDGAMGYKKGIKSNDNDLSGEDYMLIRRAREMHQIPKRIELQLALYKPNIISFSESVTKNTIAKMAEGLNMNYAYFPGAKNGNGHWPGTILTNLEIIRSENRPFVDKKTNNPKELFTRHWGKAKLRLKNGTTITVHSAHLWPTTQKGAREIRLAEIEELLKSIHYDLDHNTESVLLQGDLNHTPGTPEYKKLKEGGLVDVFAKVGNGKGYTARPTYYPTKPEPEELSRRIDYIFGIGPIVKQITECRTLFEGDFRLNNDDPKSFALSDHIPLLGEFII